MHDEPLLWLFLIAATATCANLLLLLWPLTERERRFWHKLRVQALRRRLTRSRGAPQRHRDGETIRIARANIVWHIVLSALFTALLFHDAIRTGPFRPAAYLLVLACLAYLAGSVVQRQKILIATRRTRSLRSRL